MKKVLALFCVLAMLMSMTTAASAADEVVAIYNDREYTDIQALVADYQYGYITLLADMQDLVFANNMVWIDLNGHDIRNISVEEGLLICKDSQTDDYTVADGVYGEISGTIVGEIAVESGYEILRQESGVSFHALSMGIYEMTLRPSVAGVYYNSYFLADEVLAARIERYGVALSVSEYPNIFNIETNCVCSYFTDFESGDNGNLASTTLLKNIMKSL